MDANTPVPSDHELGLWRSMTTISMSPASLRQRVAVVRGSALMVKKVGEGYVGEVGKPNAYMLCSQRLRNDTRASVMSYVPIAFSPFSIRYTMYSVLRTYGVIRIRIDDCRASKRIEV